MKIAVFHNFIDNIGGAEIVALTLARELGADIYTTNIDKEKIEKMGFPDVLPRIFSIGKVPVNAPWRQQIVLWKFWCLDLKSKCDFFIIAGDWAMSGAVNNKPNLWYVHSPIREIWDLHHHVRKNLISFWERPFFDLWVWLNRGLNQGYMKDVGKIICNSENTKDRIKKYLNRKAVVINPPIETSKLYCAQSKGYWLSVGRLIKHKRIGLQLKVFSRLPDEKLIIVGSYERARHFLKHARWCQKMKPDNVEIRSWVGSEELIALYAHCKGFITTAQDEDFGMNVVEAMAAGKPVIAPNEGGYKETIINGQTGVLIDDIDENKLRETILGLGRELDADPERYKVACQTRAKQFDVRVFIEKIKNEINRGNLASLRGKAEQC